MLHAYLIWSGDILVIYAICGVLLYGLASYGRWAYEVTERVEANEAAGIESQAWELGVREGWGEGVRLFLHPNKADIAAEVDLYTSGYLEIVAGRAPEVLAFQVFGFFIFAFWGAGGIGARGGRDDDLQSRVVEQVDQAFSRGGTNGADPLPIAIAPLYHFLLWVRIRDVRHH